jgi:RNA polymerase sigma-70 factor, ECF subfamily
MGSPSNIGVRPVALYDVLARVEPSPIVDLNWAVAMAMRDGREAGPAGGGKQ